MTSGYKCISPRLHFCVKIAMQLQRATNLSYDIYGRGTTATDLLRASPSQLLLSLPRQPRPAPPPKLRGCISVGLEIETPVHLPTWYLWSGSKPRLSPSAHPSLPGLRSLISKVQLHPSLHLQALTGRVCDVCSTLPEISM